MGFRLENLLMNPLNDLLDLEGQPISFGHALYFRVTESRPENGCKLTVSIKPLIVQFHDNDLFKLTEDLLQAVGQGMNVLRWSADH